MQATTQRRPYARTAGLAVALAAVLLLSFLHAPGAHAALRVFNSIGVTADGQGYAPVGTDGSVYAYGAVAYRGNPSGFTGGIVGISVTADGQGYAAVSGSGQVYAYGTAVYRGNPTGFTGGIVGIAMTADGQGYAAISGSGQVYAYGTAVYRGNPTGFTGGIKGIAMTADGQGYAAVSGSGQVYAYGTVRYWGNGDPGSDDGSATRSRVAAIAQAESTNTARNAEVGADCNFYSGAVNHGAPACSGGPGWRAEAWCADFAKWVWQQAGANPAGLTPGAVSIRDGRTSTWHAGSALSGVQVGDLIGWYFNDPTTGNDHVSIVVAVGPTFITTIDGNYSNRITKRTDVTRGNTSISGYATMTL